MLHPAEAMVNDVAGTAAWSFVFLQYLGPRSWIPINFSEILINLSVEDDKLGDFGDFC